MWISGGPTPLISTSSSGCRRRDKRSFCAFMQRHLFAGSTCRGPCAFSGWPQARPRSGMPRFEREIASLGGIDLLLLGIGGNAHIGFNEPARVLQARTHRAALTVETRRANASLFGGRLTAVPREALTMGIGTMMDARSIVLIATGRQKSRAVASIFSGQISPAQPASVLQLHPKRRGHSGLSGRGEASEVWARASPTVQNRRRAACALCRARRLRMTNRRLDVPARARSSMHRPPRIRGRSRAPTMRRARSRSFSEFDFTSTIRFP